MLNIIFIYRVLDKFRQFLPAGSGSRMSPIIRYSADPDPLHCVKKSYKNFTHEVFLGFIHALMAKGIFAKDQIPGLPTHKNQPTPLM